MEWFPLTLACAFFLASSDAATKAWLGGYRARELALLRFSATGLVLAPVALSGPLTLPPAPFWGWIALLVPLEIAAMLLYMRAIRDHPLSATLPYLAFTPVFVTLTGWLLLGERVNLPGFGGIALVVAGAWVLNLRRGARRRAALLAPFGALARNEGPRLMLAVAFLYSVTSVGGKGAMQYMPPEQFGAFYFALLGILVALLFGLRDPAILWRIWRRPAPAALVVVLTGLMVVTHFLALQRVEVAYMIAVKRTSLLFGILYGALFFGEPELRRHLAAGTLMVAGILLIAVQ